MVLIPATSRNSHDRDAIIPRSWRQDTQSSIRTFGIRLESLSGVVSRPLR